MAGDDRGPSGGSPGNSNDNGHACGPVRGPWLEGLALPAADLGAGSIRIWPAGGGRGDISPPGDAQSPVFVLTVARSGSTLLRFILDSHPDLACPPETNVGQACFGLARVWDTLDPSPESASREFSPNEVSDLTPQAAASIRGAVDEVYGRYLAQHGKRRWCDKSLDSTRMAGLLARLYPAAQFVCLYRHCMDVAVSAIDAAPWGLNGYGFDQYVMGTPGNTVLAAVRCWLDQTTAIIDFQAKYPNRCHGIRYEDLVTGPEEIAAELFTFLGVTTVPGITETCLAQAHEIRGPGDHKIWFTSRIKADSLGQGTRVPAAMLPTELVAKLNETLEQLAYRQVDDDWRAASGPIDPRADIAPETTAPETAADGRPEDPEAEAAAAEISGRLVNVPEQRARELAGRWPEAVGQTLCLAVEPAVPGTGVSRRWTLSWQDGDLTVSQENAEPPADARTLAAPARTWLALFGGTANMAAELRAGKLRFLEPLADTAGPGHRQAATHLLAYLIGLGGSGDVSTVTVPNRRER
jgi:hypothetical protein